MGSCVGHKLYTALPDAPATCVLTPVVSMMQNVVLLPLRGFCEAEVDSRM